MTTTTEVLIAAAILFVAYDIFVLIKDGASATISATLLALSKEHPIIAFVLGVIVGHVLWSQ